LPSALARVSGADFPHGRPPYSAPLVEASTSQPCARTVLIGYDGSAHADHAIDEAARLFPGANALVMTAWRSVRDVAHAGRAALPEDVVEKATTEMDEVAEAAAKATAQAGAERAHAAGLNASPQVACVEGSVAEAILKAADEHDVMTVVLGSRGRSGFRSALLGSVSNTVVQHSAKPVVVVHGEPADDPG
jgi:nucleotide-binding universal stress UspA family protein